MLPTGTQSILDTESPHGQSHLTSKSALNVVSSQHNTVFYKSTLFVEDQSLHSKAPFSAANFLKLSSLTCLSNALDAKCPTAILVTLLQYQDIKKGEKSRGEQKRSWMRQRKRCPWEMLKFVPSFLPLSSTISKKICESGVKELSFKKGETTKSTQMLKLEHLLYEWFCQKISHRISLSARLIKADTLCTCWKSTSCSGFKKRFNLMVLASNGQKMT